MMLLDTSFNPLNLFPAPIYYKFYCRKSEYLEIRHFLIKQATARLKFKKMEKKERMR